jgi:hypothetical protein
MIEIGSLLADSMLLQARIVDAMNAAKAAGDIDGFSPPPKPQSAASAIFFATRVWITELTAPHEAHGCMAGGRNGFVGPSVAI